MVEQTLLRVLFAGDPAPGASVLLSDVRGRFNQAEPQIRDALYQAMVNRGYFTVSPATTRMRWRRGAWIGFALSIFVGLFLTIRVDPFAILATIAAAILFLVLVRVSRAMPQKTAVGAEASQKWQAFRRYLQSIEKYEKLDEATDLFDRYFAYAIAFGLEKGWVRAFAKAGARTPGWFMPVGGSGDIGDILFDSMTIGHMTGHIGGSSVDMPNVDLPNLDMPNMPDMGNIDLKGMSDLAGGSLQGASEVLGGLLDAAGSVFDAIDFDIFN
jgi:hypothetical protein